VQGKVCLVTGASSGIGRETALGLAKLGATVILLCRDVARGEAARDDIRMRSGNADVALLCVDLASQRSIRAGAVECMAKWPILHVLVNNAGISSARRIVSEDGYELTLAVNHLGPFLLTNLLLPALRAGAPSRVVNVTSRLERMGRIDFEDLQSARHYNGLRAYARSKLANVLFTYELAERLRGAGITANCVHPGGVATNIVRDRAVWIRWLWAKLFAPPAIGARTPIFLASSPEVEGVTGQYFEPPNRAAVSSPRSHDVALRRRLWDVSVALTGATTPSASR
jgi:NAD(P)-dependent dehydrogenase (short-subunit alcohol dehydrogenase family)